VWWSTATTFSPKTYRFQPHTSDDDDRTYRTREEVDAARHDDPLIRFAGYLKEEGLIDDAGIEALAVEIKEELDGQIDEAWNAPDPDPATLARHVFAEPEVSPQ
jgi:2-oxoisovalerate dehydrogenase E1 component alpha subunit